MRGNLCFSGRLELIISSVQRNQSLLVSLADFLELENVASSVGEVNLSNLQSGTACEVRTSGI